MLWVLIGIEDIGPWNNTGFDILYLEITQKLLPYTRSSANGDGKASLERKHQKDAFSFHAVKENS